MTLANWLIKRFIIKATIFIDWIVEKIFDKYWFGFAGPFGHRDGSRWRCPEAPVHQYHRTAVAANKEKEKDSATPDLSRNRCSVGFTTRLHPISTSNPRAGPLVVGGRRGADEKMPKVLGNDSTNGDAGLEFVSGAVDDRNSIDTEALMDDIEDVEISVPADQAEWIHGDEGWQISIVRKGQNADRFSNLILSQRIP